MREKHQCCAHFVNPNGWSRSLVRCSKTGKFERDGFFYCGIHDPVAVKERDAKLDAERKQKFKDFVRSEQLKRAAPDLLDALRKALDVISAMGLPDEVTDNVVAEGRAAVAKAEGRT